jgi:hypothetical protein
MVEIFFFFLLVPDGEIAITTAKTRVNVVNYRFFPSIFFFHGKLSIVGVGERK